MGVLVEAPVSLAYLRKQIKPLTIVKGEGDGKTYYSRFHDPGVLRVFLPSSTLEEIRQLFGPIVAFYCEGDGGSELLPFTLLKDGLSAKRWPIVGTPAATAGRTP